MALSLLAALIALGLLHLLPQLAQWRGDGVFRGWVRQLDDTDGRSGDRPRCSPTRSAPRACSTPR